MHRYKDLKFWQKSMDMAQMVFEITSEFPTNERYGLTAQLRRAAVSVPSNIAEGAGRGTNADFNRFLDIANGSLNEIETQFLLSERFDLISKDKLETVRSEVDQIQKMIFNFQITLKK
tara:strand:+ start:522 stop:875 length:354 start_codon:yes stop_codon:yes gene_type:complete